MLFLIPLHCLRCIIIGYSKWGRFGAILQLSCIIIGYSKWGCFGAILNSFALSKMHYYWLLKVGALWCYS